MTIELLAPAGTIKNMRYAFAYGADAVYAGQPRYSLRVRNNDFQLENLKTGIDEAHALGRKFFVASNLLPHNNKLKRYLEHMQPVIDMRPDALIMADPGLIMMVRERWPEIPVHLSVQANTMNYASVKFWQSVGISRIILSREISWTRSKKFVNNALIWSWKYLCMGHCALLILGAACFRVILITVMPIREVVPMLAVGNMACRKVKKM
jgi:collagenase-like PrtC family protease